MEKLKNNNRVRRKSSLNASRIRFFLMLIFGFSRFKRFIADAGLLPNIASSVTIHPDNSRFSRKRGSSVISCGFSLVFLTTHDSQRAVANSFVVRHVACSCVLWRAAMTFTTTRASTAAQSLASRGSPAPPAGQKDRRDIPGPSASLVDDSRSTRASVRRNSVR